MVTEWIYCWFQTAFCVNVIETVMIIEEPLLKLNSRYGKIRCHRKQLKNASKFGKKFIMSRKKA